jgi:hypothetical protein
MKIPYVIDNQTHRLIDVRQQLLAEHADKSIDIATAYFTVAAHQLRREDLRLICFDHLCS